MEYPKIQTLFKRDDNHIIIPSEFTKPEFNWLRNCKFRAEEKIDGTNIRVEIDFNDGFICVQFVGRTGKSIIPTHLYKKLEYLFEDKESIKKVFFSDKEPKHVTLHGEGYGYKIQNGENYISDDVDFMLFDARIGNTWVDREELENIANQLHLSIVPVVGMMTINEAIQYVNKGFKSMIAENANYDAEGLVLKTPNNILLKSGERICIKLKTKDFTAFEEIYGSINYTIVNNNLFIYTDAKQPVTEEKDT